MEQVLAGEDGVGALFDLYYLSLVRLAVQLVDDLDAAEDVVQDVFAHDEWIKGNRALGCGDGIHPPTTPAAIGMGGCGD